MGRDFKKCAASTLWIADSCLAVLMAVSLAAGVAALAAAEAERALWAAGGVLLAALLRAALQIWATSAGEVAAVSAKAGWRQRIYPHILVSAPGDRRMLGETVADAVDRIEDLGGFHARFLPFRHAALVSPFVIAVAAMFASKVAGAIMLATLLPFGVGMALAGTAAKNSAKEQLDALSRLSGLFVDRVRALPIIVAFGAERRISRHLENATQEVATRTLKVLKVAFASSAVIEFFAALSVALVALYCGFNLLDLLPFPAPEKLTLGAALFVLLLAPEFYLPMRRLAAAYHEKQLGEAAIERLENIAPVQRQPVIPSPLSRPPTLKFDNVVIDYQGTAVGPFSFDIKAGTSLALRGVTGVGKSSLLHALLGLAPVGEGQILIEGQSAADIRLSGNIGWAGQTVTFVPGTLAENIRLARPEADDDAVEEAALRAGLGPLLSSRGQGMRLLLDHRGSGLSGGERRRVGIARVLLKNAPLWLLDEPTADLDAQSADDIAQILATSFKGRTVLMVTHSARLAMIADKEVVIV